MSSESIPETSQSEYGAHAVLLVMLALLLVQATLRAHLPTDGLVFDTVITMVFAACIYAASQKRWTLIAASLLAVPTIGLQWLSSSDESGWMIGANTALTGAFLVFATGTTLSSVLRARDIKLDTILGAVAAYLLIGCTFIMAFVSLERAIPGSFLKGGEVILVAPQLNLTPDFIYFSFVTLTTLGYGDITPMTDVARLLSITEAIVGQLYIAILIASLVAKRISQHGATPPQ